MQRTFHCFVFLFITIIYSSFLRSGAQPYNYPSANTSAKWTNSLSLQVQPVFTYIAGLTSGPILLRGTSGPAFACGFVCSDTCNSFLFSIFIFNVDNDNYFNGATIVSPDIVWSANRNHPVQDYATLKFTKTGDLILRDFDGTKVWSTNTSGKSVVRMDLNDLGSLVLFDNENKTVWSSIDHPTDSLVLGQTLKLGQRLTANTSATNSSQGQLYLSVVKGGFQTFVGSNPPQMYYQSIVTNGKNNTCVKFNNGSLDIYAGSDVSSAPDISVPLPSATSVQYMRLDYGGHLRLYEWNFTGSILLGDVFKVYPDDCAYPTVCGEYGICSNGQCTCPATVNGSLSYFRPVDQRNPNVGCMPFTAISCESNITQQFLLLSDVSYFNYIDYSVVYMENTNTETCKQACLVNCSCKAALFQYGQNPLSGNCYLPSELFSLTNNRPDITHYNSSEFIKVQPFPVANSTSGTNSSNFSTSTKVSPRVIVGVSVGSVVAFLLVNVCVIALVRRRNRHSEDNEDEFNILPGLPTRFTFEDLRVATNDFLRKLGEGGFGSVFEGALIDGTKIAVKRLDGVGQGKKEFLAEVETIGSIHHIHLVRLVGFCAERSYRLLVYEYMSNGSLDKWIFYKDNNTVLDWETRRKIIADIAKGLAYLHEECRQKIVHLDIKPQNILLDENFDAKVSDFGLAKLIDRDQIQVMTRMRGTPGYLAPEWLTSFITEKVDVFSFGVVVLEIICGRKNLDYSKDEESVHLISLLQQKVEEQRIFDIVDCRCTDMQQLHIDDVTVIMHLAMWCLQSDSNKRPSMSLVVKVLEGSMNVEANLDYNFSNPAPYVSRNVNIVESVPPVASVLSGPR